MTSRDIARLAGVSQATVSRVLRGEGYVSDVTRAKVLAVLDETAYVPNAQARAMRTQRTGTLGVVTGRITNPFYPELLDEISAAIADKGLRMVLWTSDESSGEEGALSAIRSGLVDGLVFTTALPDSPTLNKALELGLPLVLVNRGIEAIRCDQVISDNRQSGVLAARYAIGAGRRRVAVIGANELISTSRERRRGFVEECGRLGVSIPPDRLPEGDLDHDGAQEMTERLLASDRPPEAIFCMHDVAGCGALDAARRMGRSVPHDLWVIGCDDIQMASWGAYELTSLRQATGDMSRLAVDLLLARLAAPGRPHECRRFDVELVVRRSTGHAPPPRSAHERGLTTSEESGAGVDREHGTGDLPGFVGDEEQHGVADVNGIE